MKVLIADRFTDAAMERFRALPAEIVYEPDLKGDALCAALPDVDVLVVRSTEVRAPQLEKAPRLALVVRAGAGVNTIDIDIASARGIYVANCPGKNAIAVAELTLGLLLAIDRRIPANHLELADGKWNKKEFAQADGLAGKTIGLVGLGSIGQEVAQRAQAFELRCLAWTPRLTEERAEAAGCELAPSLEALFREADIVSLHVSLTPETKGMVGEQLLSLMKPRAILLNTSRAEVVDTDALRAALREGRIRAGLDVPPNEPKVGAGEYGDDIANLAGIVATHHIGASTEQAQRAVADEAVRIVQSFLDTGEVPNCVNVAEHTPALSLLIVRHYDRVGVLANVLDSIKRAGINAERMSNLVFSGARAACARIELDAEVPAEVLEEIRSRTDEVIQAEQTTLGG